MMHPKRMLLPFLLLAALPGMALPGFPQAIPEAKPPAGDAAIQGLVQRLLPEQADAFHFDKIPRDKGRDVFEIESAGGRVTIRGSNGVAQAMGLNWYLKHHCRCHVAWYASQLKLPDPLPAVNPPVRKTCWARYRYFLNYCCFGYSLAFWDWPQWERLVDWMALNGINAPLSVTGQEAAWEAAMKKLGIKDAQIRDFFAGPPYLSFQWMGCLDSWGGPLPADWIARHAALGRKILDRQRSFGMTPVLQGFTGHVPAALADVYPEAKLHRIKWIEWETCLLDPMDPLFTRVGKLFLEAQNSIFGTDHLYAADTFIEMTPPSNKPEYLARLSRTILNSMTQVDPDAVWILQGWLFVNNPGFWQPPQAKALLGAIPDDRMMVLDLMCEKRPVWQVTEAFHGKPWLWCNIQSFGRTVQLSGSLPRINDMLLLRGKPEAGKLSGLGFVNEGLCYNPIIYDLMFETAWREKPVNLDRWTARYAAHRYGQTNAHGQKAWQTLVKTAYQVPNYKRSVITLLPGFYAGGGAPYDNWQLAGALEDLLKTADLMTAPPDTLLFDLVNTARQVLANHAGVLVSRITEAFRADDKARYDKTVKQYLSLLDDMDRLLKTRREFMLGPWLAEAGRWGKTPEERHKMTWNARRFITLWGTTTAIDDYASKEWSGLISDYYRPRWERFLKAAGKTLGKEKSFNPAEFNKNLRPWMLEWSSRKKEHPVTPEGDSLSQARALWQKYRRALAPEAPSLTTGKPVSCSHAIEGFPARLANDGRKGNTNSHWAMDVTTHPEAWWQVDLEAAPQVGRIVVVPFYGDQRHYGFVVATSLDGKTWTTVADRRDNQAPATSSGYTCSFKPRQVRFIRVTFTHNSANTGRHLVEVMAYGQ